MPTSRPLKGSLPAVHDDSSIHSHHTSLFFFCFSSSSQPCSSLAVILAPLPGAKFHLPAFSVLPPSAHYLCLCLFPPILLFFAICRTLLGSFRVTLEPFPAVCRWPLNIASQLLMLAVISNSKYYQVLPINVWK